MAKELVEIDLDFRHLHDLAISFPAQFAFATAGALTRTAKAAQDAETAQIVASSVIRGEYVTSPRRPGSLHLKAATKLDLNAEVNATNPLLEWMGFGGSRPLQGSTQAIPTDEGHGTTTRQLRGPGEAVALPKGQSLRPRSLVAAKTHWYQRTNSGYTVVWERLPEDRRQAVYLLWERPAQIKRKFDFSSVFARTVAARWEERVLDACDEAIHTRR